MKEENFLLFKKKVRTILDLMDKSKINVKIVSGPKIDEPAYYIKFKDRNLKNWKMGIWATGKWGGLYDIESNSEITIFMIHDWYFDKWRPSSSDISWSFLPESSYFEDFITDLLEIKKNPIKSFRDIFFPFDSYPIITYLRELCIINKNSILNKFKNIILPWYIYNILKFISIFDKRALKTKVFERSFGNSEVYTFSFLANMRCSNNDRKFHRFYMLYSYYPNKLIRKSNSRFNVSDYNINMTDEEINSRMLKGVVG